MEIQLLRSRYSLSADVQQDIAGCSGSGAILKQLLIAQQSRLGQTARVSHRFMKMIRRAAVARDVTRLHCHLCDLQSTSRDEVTLYCNDLSITEGVAYTCNYIFVMPFALIHLEICHSLASLLPCALVSILFTKWQCLNFSIMLRYDLRIN